MISNRRRQSQRGSALLIVLVLAAMIAIALYREMPVATFEAQRQKEELLMDRGNEYKRAIQLYVRKIQSFPPTIDALENTNRMRFLRARYVDPYTGKDDWRLLHAGPGGVIVDSKVKQATSNLTGASGTSAATLGSGSSVTNPFANSFDGANPNGTPGAANSGLPQRPPAISANGGGGISEGSTSDPFANLPPQALPSSNPQSAQGTAQSQTAPYPGYPGPQLDPSNSTGSNSGSFPMGAPGRFRGSSGPTGDSYPPTQYGIGASATGPQDPQNAMNAALSTNNPPPVPANAGLSFSSGMSGGGTFSSPSGSSTTGLGTMSGTTTGSGIAGVASKSTGKTIKVFNDQKDRSLWEFVYDMQKEANANAPGLGGTSGTGVASGGGTTGTGGNPGFPGSSQTGSPNQSNMFSN
jgi:hypothetical protein